MRRLWMVAALALGTIAAGQDIPGSANPAPYSAIVNNAEARFVFPLPPQPEWHWFQEATPDNQQEYMWQIRVKNGNVTYEFGYSLFKYPGRRPQKGDLGALLKAGQATLWEVERQGGREVGRVAGKVEVAAVGSGDQLVVSLRRPDDVGRVFSKKPKKAEFRTILPGEKLRSKKVAIVYAGS